MLYNRDLSWLGFNFRVLQEAADEKIPLFERIKFLSVFSSNLDEFFRVRYPALFAISRLGDKAQRKAATNIEGGLIETIHSEINRQLEQFGKILRTDIIPALRSHAICFYYDEPVKADHRHQVRELFLSQVLGFLQPVYLEGNVDEIFVPENNQLYLLVTLSDPNSQNVKQAVVNIPSDKTSRFFTLDPVDGCDHVIFLDDIIRDNLASIFPGMNVIGAYSFKINRDAEMKLEDEFSATMLYKVEKQLKKRDLGSPSRFLFEASMPKNLQLYLSSVLALSFDEMFAGGRYHNLKDLSDFPRFNKELVYDQMKPLPTPGTASCGDIFKQLDERDILLHLPYHSYNTVLSFFNQAAIHPDVTHISITLYRVANVSHIVHALISAARNGKKVTAFVELKARFDEANNIKWSRMMREAGVDLVYSSPHVKVHSKIAMVRKTKEKKPVLYGLFSTGNFHEITARFYTDHVFMTSGIKVMREVETLFDYLADLKKNSAAKLPLFQSLLVSPFNLVERLEALIGTEIAKGDQGRIRMKMNNLEDPYIIGLLYKARDAGVKIELIVRSICCLVPGIAGTSRNITVKRIVDRYLEHSRLFIFGGDEIPVVIIGSADMMTRNLKRRVEVCVTINDRELQKELIDYFNIQWSDNEKAVTLSPGMEEYIRETSGSPVNAQQSIYQYLRKKNEIPA